MYRSICSAVLTAALALIPASANAYVQDNRFAPMTDRGAVSDADNDVNVRFDKTTADRLPAFLSEQLKTVMAECLAEPADLSHLDVYTYESDYNRRERTNVNYVVDFANFYGAKAKSCAWTPLCGQNECAIWGYYALPNGMWDHAFQLPAAQWALVQVQGATRAAHYAFQVNTTDPQCPVRTSAASEECEQYFAWRGNSIVPLM